MADAAETDEEPDGKKRRKKGDVDAVPQVKAPGDLWWWVCLLVGLAGMVGLYLSGGGL